ncbi:MAG: hypothetical protein KBT34_14940 [Prevotella sp.]|nr:hypothetical protein [Candidatus Prevotella equi]
MEESLVSHFGVFTAFVQLSVAFNFSLLYLERKSSMVRISDMIHDAFISLINIPLGYAANEQKRYREDNASDKERAAYISLRDQKTKVTTKANALVRFRFLQSLGSIMGVFGILQLLNLSMLDRGQFYTDFMLVSGEFTLVYSLFLFCILLREGKNPHVVPSLLIYFFIVFLSFVLVKFDCFFHCIDNIARVIHWLLLLAYLPFLLFFGYLLCHYAKRIPLLFVMHKQTKRLHMLMDAKRDRAKMVNNQSYIRRAPQYEHYI